MTKLRLKVLKYFFPEAYLIYTAAKSKVSNYGLMEILLNPDIRVVQLNTEYKTSSEEFEAAYNLKINKTLKTNPTLAVIVEYKLNSQLLLPTRKFCRANSNEY